MPNDSPTDTGVKEPEGLGSVLSFHPPSEFSTKQMTGHQFRSVMDHADPFQSALRDTKRESACTGKVPGSTHVPPLSGSSNLNYSLWTCGKQLEDIPGCLLQNSVGRQEPLGNL